MSWLVGVASAGSLCAILVSLFSIGSIVNDISSLQDEVHAGMSEFRVSTLILLLNPFKLVITRLGVKMKPGKVAERIRRDF